MQYTAESVFFQIPFENLDLFHVKMAPKHTFLLLKTLISCQRKAMIAKLIRAELESLDKLDDLSTFHNEYRSVKELRKWVLLMH